jgi:hypothetical protein
MTNSTSKTQTKAQTQPEPFSAEQRKGMARLLADAKERVKNGLESDYDLNGRIEGEILPKLAGERGATSSIEKVWRLRKELKEAETTLGKLGFICSEYADHLSLADEAPKELEQAVEKAQRSARKDREAQLLKYDKAILIVWAAQDADEAKGTVEELL